MTNRYEWQMLGGGDYVVLDMDKVGNHVVARSGNASLIEGICDDLNEGLRRQRREAWERIRKEGPNYAETN